MTIDHIFFTAFPNTAVKKFPYSVLVLDASILYYWNNFPLLTPKYDSYFKFPTFAFFLLWNCSFLFFPNILYLFWNAFSDWNVYKKFRGKLVFRVGTKLSLSVSKKGTIKSKVWFCTRMATSPCITLKDKKFIFKENGLLLLQNFKVFKKLTQEIRKSLAWK